MSFPLIAGEDDAVQRMFGVLSTLGLLPGRVTYVIDKKGIDRLIFSARFASNKHVREALKAVVANYYSLPTHQPLMKVVIQRSQFVIEDVE